MRLLLLFALSCGNHIDHGLDGDRPIQSITSEETAAFCDAYGTLLEESYGPHEACVSVVLIRLNDPVAPAPASECDAIYDACRRDPPESDYAVSPGEQCVSRYLAAETCTLTVDEVTTCLEDRLEKSLAGFRKFTCDDPYQIFDNQSEYCDTVELRCR